MISTFSGALSRHSVVAVLLAAVMTGASGMGGAVLAASDVHPSVLPWLNLADDLLGRDFVLRAVEALAGPTDVSAGTDGRITVLMVGSDHRDGNTNGERTDTIMVMSLNPNNSEISAVSIPRDTARVPLAPSLGGGIFKNKINGMFKFFKKKSGGSREQAMEKLRVEVEFLLATPIDYVAFIRFNGFDALVDQAGGITTDIPGELRDPDYIDKPGWPTGAKFLAQNNAVLGGGDAERCYGGYPKPVTNWGPVPNCHRALVYVRSRHGTVGGVANSDFKRAARQQVFIFDALKQVRQSLSTAQSIRVRANLIPKDFYTTIPISTPSDGLALFQLVQGATLAHQQVFSPPNYATKVNLHYELKLTTIRALCDSWMGPV